MTQKLEQSEGRGPRRRWRQRAAACMSGRKGKTIGLSALAAPIAGFIVNDLRKPDSLIRRLVASTIARLNLTFKEKRKELNIGDKAEVIVHDKQE